MMPHPMLAGRLIPAFMAEDESRWTVVPADVGTRKARKCP